jgi:hypothetical protein
MAGWAAAGQIAGDIFNNMWSNDKADARQEDQQNFNAEQAQANRDFEERMSNTAFQRQATDLRAAGMNPMLGYMHASSGAPVPSGSAATSGIAGAANHPVQISSAFQAQSQIDLNEAVKKRTEAEESKTRAEETEVRARTPTYEANIAQIAQNIDESKTRMERILAEIPVQNATAAQLEQQTKNLQEQIPQIKATIEQLRTIKILEARHSNLQLPKAGMDAAVNDSFIGALGAVLRAINPLAGLVQVTK